MDDIEYLESRLIGKSNVDCGIFSFFGNIRLGCEKKFSFYRHISSDNTVIKENQISSRSPYICFSGEYDIFVRDDESFCLLLWLGMCIEMFVRRQLGKKCKIKRFKGISYGRLKDYLIIVHKMQREISNEKKKEQVFYITIKETEVLEKLDSGYCWHGEFDENEMIILKQLIQKSINLKSV